MKPIQQLLPQTLHAMNTQPHESSANYGKWQSSSSIQQITTVVATQLIPTMNLYSRDFSNRFGAELGSVVQEFVKQIGEAGLSANDVMIGIEAFKQRAATAP